MNKIKQYQNKHELDVSSENEVLPPDYQAHLDSDEWWQAIDADEEYQSKFVKDTGSQPPF